MRRKITTNTSQIAYYKNKNKQKTTNKEKF